MGMSFQFEVPDISCYTCVNAIESVLKAHNKNKDDKASRTLDRSANKILFKIDQSLTDPGNKHIGIYAEGDCNHSDDVCQQIKKIIEDAGFDNCREINRCASEDAIYQQKKAELMRSYLLKGVLGSVSGLGFMVLCVSGVAIPFMGMSGLAVLSAALTLALGAQTYYQTAKLFYKSRTLTMDSLFAMSTLTTTGVTIASIFIPRLPMMMEAGLLTFGFRYLGKAIEEKIKSKMNTTLSFRDRAPKHVQKYVKGTDVDVIDEKLINQRGKWQFCTVSDIQVNDIICIRKGSVIPFDGHSLNQKSLLINDRLIHGSTYDRVLKKNEALLAGMEVPYDTGDDLIMQVSRSEADSHLAQLDLAIENANHKKAPIENVTRKILKYFVPGVLSLSALSGVLVSIFFSPALAIQCATSLLVSACPCTLGFITPLALQVGMAKAIENGIQFKNGKALQSANEIEAIVFDLNGTLTTGQLEVTSLDCFSEEENAQDEFYNCLYNIERQSQHPIAKLIRDYIENNKRKHLSTLVINNNDIKKDHAGLSVKINNNEYLVGNKNFLKQHHIKLTQEQKRKVLGDGQRNVYLVKNRQVIGYVSVKDPLRPEAKWVIDELKKKNKEVHICTGADRETAKIYAKELGIPVTHIQANCVDGSNDKNSNSKMTYIESLQKRSMRVAMVGDAGNDALALKKSNFGIAIRSSLSDEITQQKAGAIIDINENNDNRPLISVLNAFAIARETVSGIKQNLIASLIYNTSMMLVAGGALVALGVVLNPGVCVGMMILQTSGILLNEYRIRQKKIPYVQQFNVCERVKACEADLAKDTKRPQSPLTSLCSTQKMLNQMAVGNTGLAQRATTEAQTRQKESSCCQTFSEKIKQQINYFFTRFQYAKSEEPSINGASMLSQGVFTQSCQLRNGPR